MLFRISAVPFLIKGVSNLLICVKKGERREGAQVHSRRKKTGLQDLKPGTACRDTERLICS